MTILEANNFYKQDNKLYQINQNEEFIKWLNDKIDNGYSSLISIKDLQELIDFLVNWYEIKYPEKELEMNEGIRYFEFINIERLSKEMNFRQLMYRISHNEYCLINCKYRSRLGGSNPIYKNNEIVGYDSIIGIQIKRKNRQNVEIWELYDCKNYPYFLIFADPVNGKVKVQKELKEYIKKEQISLEHLLLILENKYKEELDFEELESCIFNHKTDLELRNKILQLVALKLVYSRNTIPERGYERAKRFINEFNKKLNLNIDTYEIDEIINRNYRNIEESVVENKIEGDNDSSLFKIKKLINPLFKKK